jgi:hypothetical protein
VRPFIITFFIFFSFHAGYAQVDTVSRPPQGNLPVKTDTTNKVPGDAVLKQPSDTLTADSVKTKPPKGDIETTINYSARDSIRASMDSEMVWLYGEAKVTYGDIELDAEEIVIDYARGTLTANGKRDSTGQRIGYPIFKNGQELYETKGIIYNFKTKRARISEVVTQQGDSYIHADAAYKNEKNEILSLRNRYTTCNLEHPHYVIRSSKTKAIPKDKIVSGPFHFEFNQIPLPIGFLFGMFPSQRESASGIIFPSYGEEKRRGFNLRNGGYFFDISEYLKLAVTADIYSKGGHAINVNSSYLKRYRYSGTVNFSYSNNPDQDDKIETTGQQKDFRLSWSHSPQSKGSGRFAASVNAATSTYTTNNNLMMGTPGELSSSNLNNLSTKLSSNVSYNKRFVGTPFNASINMRHDQDLITNVVDLSLPTLAVNMINQYPFQRKDGKATFMDNFSVSYSMGAQNRVTNNLGKPTPYAKEDSIAPFNMSTLPTLFANGKKGMRHTMPISFSMKALKHFTLSPSINYEEKWYGERLEWGYDLYEGDTLGIVRKDTVSGFNRIANYGFNVGLTTRVYGTFFFKKGKVKAIRHILNPTVSFNYTPDFTINDNYFQKFTLNGSEVLRSRHEGFVYGSSATGRSSSIGFGLSNNLEMKVQSDEDSVARKVMLLNNLSFSSGYNLIADSFKLSNIGISANTNILNNKLNVNLSATLDPYNYVTTNVEGVEVERKVDEYAWKSQRLGRITSATLNISTNLNPKKRSKDTSSRDKIAQSDLPEQEKEFLLAHPDVYVDFDIPWSLNLAYNLNYQHGLGQDPSVVQAITANGTLALSEKWQITYSTGFHVEEGKFTTSNFGISRDLHCWTFNLNWTPFGYYESYNVTIAVKSSVLKDLKMERRKPFFDNL